MAFTCTIKTHSAGLLGKEPSMGLIAERFIARRDVKVLINLKADAVKDIIKHNIEDALEKSCKFLQEQYYALFHTLLTTKRAIEDTIHFVELRGVGSPQAMGYANVLVNELVELAKDGQRYGNALAEITRGKKGVALSFSSRFFININEVQKFSMRRKIKTAIRYELKAERLENANKLNEKQLIEIMSDKIEEVRALRKELKTLMIETRLFLQKLWDAIEQYDLPRQDVNAILKEATDMFENELLCFNQLAKMTGTLQKSIERTKARAAMPIAA